MDRTEKLRFLLLCVIGGMVFLNSCGGQTGSLKDGYYTAEAARYDEYQWKEFVTIGVSNGRIMAVEYNAKNSSGFIKSWDMDYMRLMNAIDGTYPNEYTRYYAEQLFARQDAGAVDALSGATTSYHTFKQLAGRVMESARTGDTSVVPVHIESPAGD